MSFTGIRPYFAPTTSELLSTPISQLIKLPEMSHGFIILGNSVMKGDGLLKRLSQTLKWEFPGTPNVDNIIDAISQHKPDSPDYDGKVTIRAYHPGLSPRMENRRRSTRARTEGRRMKRRRENDEFNVTEERRIKRSRENEREESKGTAPGVFGRCCIM